MKMQPSVIPSVFFYKQSCKYPYIYSDGSEDIFEQMTGIKVSAGAVIISQGRSAVFVDGRYRLSAMRSINLKKFEILDFDRAEIINWINKNISEGCEIAYDEDAFFHEEIDFWRDNLRKYQLVGLNLRKSLGIAKEKRTLQIHHMKNEKNVTESRLSHIYDLISKNRLDAYLVCDPCSIGWALNIRDFGTKHSSVLLCFMLVTANHDVILYLDECYHELFSETMKPQTSLIEDLNQYDTLGVDKSETPSCIKCKKMVHIKNPLISPKSIKTSSEISDITGVLKKDSAAIINFLHWFHNSPPGEITEPEAAEKILYFRKLQSGLVGESFRCISAADDHAAMVHYSPDETSNKVVENLLLLDSGGQYNCGTTDITRTISLGTPTGEQKFFYTLVLKGHIALASAKFPIGTKAFQLDSLARQFLWKHNQDYDHSSGHGVGYALNVHEGPISISRCCDVELQPGMIITNEPGFYKAGHFGIRLENMMLVKEDVAGFLSFETISLVPFDIKLIQKEMLTAEEIDWTNSYHSCILSSKGFNLSEEVIRWLADYLPTIL